MLLALPHDRRALRNAQQSELKVAHFHQIGQIGQVTCFGAGNGLLPDASVFVSAGTQQDESRSTKWSWRINSLGQRFRGDSICSMTQEICRV